MAQPFDLKNWLDRVVLPLLRREPPLLLHAVVQRRPRTPEAPEAVLVWALSETPAGWAPALRRLLEEDHFSFDYLREPQMVEVAPGRLLTLFGGDGLPFINQNRMALARLYRRGEDGMDLLLELGHPFETAEAAVAAVRSFFALFDGVPPRELAARFQPPFGPG